MLTGNLCSPMTGKIIYSTVTCTYTHNTHRKNRPMSLSEIPHSEVNSKDFLWHISHKISTERVKSGFRVSLRQPTMEFPSSLVSPPPPHVSSQLPSCTANQLSMWPETVETRWWGGKVYGAMCHPPHLETNSRQTDKSRDSSAADWVLLWLYLYRFS